MSSLLPSSNHLNPCSFLSSPSPTLSNPHSISLISPQPKPTSDSLSSKLSPRSSVNPLPLCYSLGDCL